MESLLLLIDFILMFLVMLGVYQSERLGSGRLTGLFQFKQDGGGPKAPASRSRPPLRRAPLAPRSQPAIRR